MVIEKLVHDRLQLAPAPLGLSAEKLVSDNVEIRKNFVNELVSHEASGILNWMLEGYHLYLN